MFHRVIYDNWTTLVPIISFIVMFTVFLITTIRALRIDPEEDKRLASLPLEDSDR